METDIIYNEDCLETLAKMEDNSIDLIVTSPPYNKGFYTKLTENENWHSAIDYDNYNDALEPKEYENWQKKIISECLRVLKPSGSLFYNHKDNLVGGVLSVLRMSMSSMSISKLFGIGAVLRNKITGTSHRLPSTSIG